MKIKGIVFSIIVVLGGCAVAMDVPTPMAGPTGETSYDRLKGNFFSAIKEENLEKVKNFYSKGIHFIELQEGLIMATEQDIITFLKKYYERRVKKLKTNAPDLCWEIFNLSDPLSSDQLDKKTKKALPR